MNEQYVKLDSNDEIVLLQKWFELIESSEFKQTVLASIDKRLASLQREKASLNKKLSGMDKVVEAGQYDSRIEELNNLKEFFEMKARKYQRKLKGD